MRVSVVLNLQRTHFKDPLQVISQPSECFCYVIYYVTLFSNQTRAYADTPTHLLRQSNSGSIRIRIFYSEIHQSDWLTFLTVNFLLEKIKKMSQTRFCFTLAISSFLLSTILLRVVMIDGWSDPSFYHNYP